MLPPKYDSLDLALVDDPYPTYARLREAAPLCRGGLGQWVVTRHAEIASLLRDPGLGHEFPEEYHRFALGNGVASTFFQRILLYRDPPRHTQLRGLMTQAFTPSLLQSLIPRIESLADSVLDKAAARGTIDLVADLALPLPVQVICELLGVPAEDRDEVQPRASDLAKAFGTQIAETDQLASDLAVVWLREYIGRLLDERNRHPGADLLTRMAAAETNGLRFTRDEIVDNTVFLFFAGFETTTNLLGNAFGALLANPHQLHRLRRDPSLMSSAVEEFLRFDPPIQGVARMVKSAIAVGDHRIRPGRVVILLLGSANRDPRQFKDPDRLDLGRRPNPHVSFGGGIHGCLGAVLARVETSIVLSRFLNRFSGIELVGTPMRSRNTRMRGYANLPVHLIDH